MPETKVKTLINNEMREVSDVPITHSNELWNEYKLEDGTLLRVKFAAGSVMRLSDYDAENNPVYILKGTVLTMPIVVPEELKKKN